MVKMHDFIILKSFIFYCLNIVKFEIEMQTQILKGLLHACHSGEL